MAARARRAGTGPDATPGEIAAAPAFREVTVHEAKTHLSRRIAPLGEGQPMKRGPRVAGSMKGLIAIDDRFFEPLPEEELRAWEGG